MLAKLGEGKGVWDRVSAIVLDTPCDESAFVAREKAFACSFVWEVDYDEPGSNGNKNREEAFDNLENF